MKQRRHPVKPPVAIPATPLRPRGRPRSEKARRAILKAARELIEDGGVTALTIESVAARAGVGKPTIYRTWPNAHAVAMAALIDAVDTRATVRSGGSAVLALGRQLAAIAEVFASRTGRSVATILAASDSETELSRAFRNHFILARRREGRALLELAIKRRELRADLDLDVALDLIYAPIFYRLLVGHLPLDRDFTSGIVSHAVRGLGTKSRPT